MNDLIYCRDELCSSANLQIRNDIYVGNAALGVPQNLMDVGYIHGEIKIHGRTIGDGDRAWKPDPTWANVQRKIKFHGRTQFARTTKNPTQNLIHGVSRSPRPTILYLNGLYILKIKEEIQDGIYDVFDNRIVDYACRNNNVGVDYSKKSDSWQE